MYSVCFIVGQHRSGTSALAGCLNTLGCKLGPDHADERDEYNQVGYFENKAIENFNEDVFRGLGTSWADITPVNFSFDRSNRFWIQKKIALRALIREQLDGDPKSETHGRTLVIKDPRISLLIGLYEAALDGIDDIRATFIFSRRNIEENTESLVRRGSLPGKMSQNHAAKLLRRYLDVFEANRSGRYPTIFHTYSNLFSETEIYLRQVDSLLSLNLDFSQKRVDNLRQFVQLDLHHERSLAACKVVSTFFGPRRLWPSGRLETKDMWQELLRLEGTVDPGDSLDTVIVLHDNGDRDAVSFVQSLDGRPTKFGKIRIIIRPWEDGIGASFRSFDFAYQILRREYFFWIFDEDNLLIISDGYLTSSRNQLDRNGASFIAFALLPNHRPKISGKEVVRGRRIIRFFPWGHQPIWHAHGGCGLTHRDHLDKIIARRGSLPFAPIRGGQNSAAPSAEWYRRNELDGEVAFTAEHYLVGGRVVEIRHPEKVTLYPGDPYLA